jgi:hypothetical protein
MDNHGVDASAHLSAGQSEERGVSGDAETAGFDGPGPPLTHAIAQLATEPHFAMHRPHGAFLPISAVTASLGFAAVLTPASSDGVHTAPAGGAGAVETVPPPPPPAQEWRASFARCPQLQRAATMPHSAPRSFAIAHEHAVRAKWGTAVRIGICGSMHA